MPASEPARVPDPTSLPTPTRATKPLSGKTVITVAVVVTLLTIGAITGLLWWVAASGLTGTELTTTRVEAIKIGLSVAIGGGGVFALYLAWRRQRSNEEDHQQRERALEHQRQVARDTNHDALERRITDLYTKAADQLGSDKAPVRLAGLYALERLAQNNPDQRQTIVNVLCAYLRMPYEGTESTESTEQAADETTVEHAQERQVRLAAQRLLTSHLRRVGDPDMMWAGITLDLTGATLLDFDFGYCDVQDASFDDARFHGPARFSRAIFHNHGSFRRAWFGGDAQFLAAKGDGMMFDEAHFGRSTKFDMAEFGWAEFTHTRFAGLTTFDGTRFHARVSFMWATFGQYAAFRTARFDNLASFDDAEFAGAAVFDDATFNSGVGFARATFGDSAVFSETEFASEASFTLTNFKGNALFGGSKFRESVNFGNALFGKDAWFHNTELPSEVWVHAYARVDVAKDDARRIWPNGWVLVEPTTPEDGRLRDREGIWGELVNAAMFGGSTKRDVSSADAPEEVGE